MTHLQEFSGLFWSHGEPSIPSSPCWPHEILCRVLWDLLCLNTPDRYFLPVSCPLPRIKRAKLLFPFGSLQHPHLTSISQKSTEIKRLCFSSSLLSFSVGGTSNVGVRWSVFGYWIYSEDYCLFEICPFLPEVYAVKTSWLPLSFSVSAFF